MRQYNLRLRILLPLTLAIAMLLSAFMFAFYRFTQRRVNADVSRTLESVHHLFVAELENDAGMMGVALDTILLDKEFKTALKARHRKALLERALPIFEELNSEHRVTHLSFIGPDRVSILRVHRPDDYGDTVDRITALDDRRDAKHPFGIEQDRLGTFTLRVIEPWYDGEELIGYVEAGEDIGHITRSLKEILGAEFYFFVSKERIDRQGWENLMRTRGLEAQWDRLPTMVLVDQSMEELPPGLMEFISEPHDISVETSVDASLKDRRYHIRFIRLDDTGGRLSAIVAVMSDVTGLIADQRATVFLTSVVCIGVAAVLSLLFYVLVRRVEVQLARANRELLRISKAVEATSDAVIMTDTKGKCFYQNRACLAMFGYTVGEWNAAGGPAVLCVDQAMGNKVFKTTSAGSSWAAEMEVRTRTDSSLPVMFRADAIKDETGNVTGLIGIYTDITERKHGEKEKKDLETQIKRAEKMEAMGTLAGGVAHDLNNILSGIVSYPDLLLLDLPEDSPLRRPVLTIQKSGKRAAAIVNDLLTLARRGVQVSEVANLNEIVSEYLGSPEHEKLKAFHPNVRVEAHLDKDLLNVLGSPTHLSKTIMNLVSNAAEALPDGGKVVVSTSNRYIDKPIKGYDKVREGDYAVLIVSDNGVGISSEEIERIFEPFYTKKMMGRSGTGLGMAVVWGTVKDHDGYIDVQSTEGAGTTFELYFPVTRMERKERKRASSIEGYMGNGETILVVDDIPEQREIVSNLLNRLGYRVDTATSGEEAIEYVKDKSVDLLVLDMIMDPGLDGLDTYKKILEVRPGTRAVIVSGYSETDRIKQAQRLGAGQYIKKPYTLERIGAAVKAELRRHDQ